MLDDVHKSISRKHALALGGGLAGSLIAGASLGTAQAAQGGTTISPFWQGTINEIERIIEAQGMVSDGVLSIEIDRDDITNVTLRGVPIKPAFQINGALNFQDLGSGRVVMNSDMALKASELVPFIDQLLIHDIVFQAEHQHFYDFSPLVWFIHFRAVGNPAQLARGVKAALNVTSTPFPQTSPKNPKTPLPAQELGKIVGGTPSIGADGVVTINIPRAERIVLGDITISPFLNIPTGVVFQPFNGGQNAAAAPDFALIASEVQNVVSTMRRQAWDIGCLYNQETDEQPQLYFSHQFKTGNAIELAHEIRAGLNRTNSMLMS